MGVRAWGAEYLNSGEYPKPETLLKHLTSQQPLKPVLQPEVVLHEPKTLNPKSYNL